MYRLFNGILRQHMEISNSITGYQISLERIKNTLLESLHQGQVLQARALTSTQNKQVQLRIGKLDILAHTQLKITAGDNLTLQVIKAADPLQLSILQEQSVRTIQAEAMRAALPQQAPASELMQRLNALSPGRTGGQPEITLQPSRQTPQAMPGAAGVLLQRGGSAQPGISGALLVNTQPSAPLGVKADSPSNSLLSGAEGTKLFQAINRVLSSQIVPDQNLTAERVRLAFTTSGLFMESALATGGQRPADMKIGLLELLLLLRPQLAAARTNRPPVLAAAVERGADPVRLLIELVSQAEAGLARILFNQLLSLPGNDSDQQLWQFDLPFRQGAKSDSFQVQIQKETKQNGQGKAETRWSVKLDFALEPIGPVQARLILIGDEISSSFIAEQAETAQRLEQALPILARAFSRAGLKVSGLSATRGSTDSKSRPRFPLLDEKA